MTPEEKSLIHAIWDEPTVMLNWLVYRDWLLERDRNERARDIISACAVACGGEPPSAATDFVCPIEVVPEIEWGSKWQLTLAKPIRRTRDYVRFSMGFVRDVSCMLEFWLEFGPRILTRHPVKLVVIHDCEPEKRKHLLTTVPWTGQIPYSTFRFDRDFADSSIGRGCEGVWATEEGAVNAQSDACIRWAGGDPQRGHRLFGIPNAAQARS